MTANASKRRRPARAAGTGAAPVARVDLDMLPSLVGYFLRRLQQAYKDHFFRESEGLDLSMKDVAALLIVGRNPGLTPSQLGAAMTMDATMTSLLLADLERAGLVLRKTAEGDRRSRTISLTERGRALIPRVRRTIIQLDEAYTAALTDTERAALLGLLARVWAMHAGEPVGSGPDEAA